MKQRGFSLIELLVVIALIVIVAALLLGVIPAAKHRTNHTACMSNLRQLGTGFSSYYTDHDQRKPPIQLNPYTRQAAWSSTFTREYGKTSGLGLLFGEYFKGYEIALCPGKDKVSYDYEKWRWRKGSEKTAGSFYAYYWFDSYSWRKQEMGTDEFLEQVRVNNMDGKNAILMDVNIVKSIFQGKPYYNHRQIKRSNVLYIDGKVRSYDYRKHTELESPTWWAKDVRKMWNKAHELDKAGSMAD